MRFSEQWLRTYVDPPLSTQALAEKLTMAGLEVEELAPAAPSFSGVVVGRIESVAPHPNADRLRVCSVNVGGNERQQIVCGAPNAAAGMFAPCALEGTTLPGGLTITRQSVRGFESRGMLCSARELGLSDDAAGLLDLGSAHPPGTDLRAALALDDTLLTLKLTPNRADCLSLVGIAREVAAVTGAPLSLQDVSPMSISSDANRALRVEDSVACPRFVARLIDGIDAKAPTPAWMKQRLERSGIRPISAVVDITNYVMLELGQPLHAYDDRLLDGAVVVRFAREGETLTLLNGQVQRLDADMLLVCDEKKPLGLAGIMGGEHSGIADDTKRVYLEGAFWNPVVIQGKMKRLGFISDAGHRFERGVDFAGCDRAVERATQLIIEICGGKAGPLTDRRGALPSRDPVRVRSARVNRLLGVSIGEETIADTFTRLGFAYEKDGDDFIVTPPSYRFDLALEEDFIEEIVRMYGYERIPATPAAHVQRMLASAEARRSPTALKSRLVARDWQEVITFTFVSSETETFLAPNAAKNDGPIRVLNPIAAHLDVMRTTLLPGLLETLRTNVSRKAPRVRIFESGRVFRHADPGYVQPIRIGGLAYGEAIREQWGSPARRVDIFDVKADIEALAAPRRVTTAADSLPWLHPGRSASVLIDGVSCGFLGELHPRLLRHFELAFSPVLFELDLEPLLDVSLPAVTRISKFPPVRRDMAIVVDEAVSAQAILDALDALKPPYVERIEPFDLYRGPGLLPGKKSLAILVLMQDTERTLTDADIDAAMRILLTALHDRFGATLRE
ncbi:MAG TPA: phenylalanine--tRNA ligase subunit beta [Casimicrobiaceae bacterium]